MEVSHKPGNLSCSETRELLSDIIDVRRGELPHPDGTRLSQPGMRAAAELHLAACEGCREELRIIEEVGFAFADFSVNEAPAQRFANYGAIVRERIARGNAKLYGEPKILHRPNRTRQIFMFGASTLAAASLAFVFTSGWMSSIFHKKQGATTVAENRKEKPSRVSRPIMGSPISGVTPVTVIVPNPAQPGPRTLVHNPQEPNALKSLQKDEWDYGYVVLGEKTEDADRPLFGAYLRTTRDVDRETLGLMVYHVVPGSPAAAMGLKANDYIVTVNGEAVSNGGVEEAMKFLAGIKNAGVGTPMNIHVVRPVGTQYLFMEKQGTLGEYDPQGFSIDQ